MCRSEYEAALVEERPTSLHQVVEAAHDPSRNANAEEDHGTSATSRATSSPWKPVKRGLASALGSPTPVQCRCCSSISFGEYVERMLGSLSPLGLHLSQGLEAAPHLPAGARPEQGEHAAVGRFGAAEVHHRTGHPAGLEQRFGQQERLCLGRVEAVEHELVPPRLAAKLAHHCRDEAGPVLGLDQRPGCARRRRSRGCLARISEVDAADPTPSAADAVGHERDPAGDPPAPPTAKR